jgi:peptidoglycan/xylan/chitin deacetylase (PgdA/CDA1 family)
MQKKFLVRMIAATGVAKAMWKATASRLRILAYHGVCSDELAGEPWIPSYFVSESNFRAQVQYVSEHCKPMTLGQAVTQLRNGTLPETAVVLTFDDGYANNLYRALPILRKYQVPASVFVSTHHVDSDELFPFDRFRLIRKDHPWTSFSRDYKYRPLDEVIDAASQLWQEVAPRVSEQQRETLRPLTSRELQDLCSAGIEIGGHTHRHCILGNETPSRRANEIETCQAMLAKWLGSVPEVFSYPNGQPGNFDAQDKKTLLKIGVTAAVTMFPGINSKSTDHLELRRLSVGLYHDLDTFIVELVGIRAALKSVLHGFSSGKNEH